jgi:hypothetical protein
MRRLGERPDLEAALARAVLTESQAGDIADWTRDLPEEMRASRPRSAARSSPATGTAPGPAAATARPPPATSTMSVTKATAA